MDQLSEYIRVSRYAQYRPDLSRRETWTEQIERVCDMHRTYYGERLTPQLQALLTEVQFDMEQRVLVGSQRNLQFGGAAVLRKHARSYNCSYSHCNRIRFFQEMFWLLLCGCGVGFSVQEQHVGKLPAISTGNATYTTIYQTEDSIEGWADSLGVLLSAYMDGPVPFPQYQGAGDSLIIKFDLVRPEGAALSWGGRAPGPASLERSLGLIRQILQGARGRQLKPIEAYDIVMHTSDAVLAGGVRRSSTICLFSKTDTEMLLAKTGNWMQDNPQRARSNNSAMLLRSQTSWEEFWGLVQATRETGDPGFEWVASLEQGFNPCSEISGDCWDPITQETGFWFCNLVEINGNLCTEAWMFHQACHSAAILGTLQAGYTDFTYLTEASRNIAKRDAMLGVSITGIMDQPHVCLDPEVLQRGARIVLETNAYVAQILGINPAVRTTCVKPSGTTAQLLGTAAGIHPRHSHRYLRLVQDNASQAPIRHYQMYNPTAVEASVWDPNHRTDVVTFAVEAPGSFTAAEFNEVKFLETVKLVQQNWVLPGTRLERQTLEGCTHNVSNTIQVQDWETAARYLYENRQFFAGVSMLSRTGDLDFNQAPYSAVKTVQSILKAYDITLDQYSEAVSLVHVPRSQLWQLLDWACSGERQLPELLAEQLPCEPNEWAGRFYRLANLEMQGDWNRTSLLLKEIANLLTWNDLRRTQVDVDWTTLIESQNNVDNQSEPACAGGSCLV